jgi:HEAT repeat protein
MGLEATPALIDVLQNDRDPEIRRRAAVALDELGPAAKAAVPALIAALKDEKVRFNAVVALSKIGPDAKAAVIPLSKLLKDPDLNINAAIALREMGAEAKPAVPALIEALKHQNEETRFYAANALGLIGAEPKACVPALIPLLKDEDEKVRGMAAQVLGVFSSEAKVILPALTEVLKDADAEVRDFAAQSLGSLAQALSDRADTSSIPAMRKTLRALEQGNFQPKLIGAVREPLETLVEKERAGLQSPLTEAEAVAAERRSRNLVVQISGQLDGENVVGTGIIFGSAADRIYIVTARHVVRQGLASITKPQVRMKSLPGEAIPAKLLEQSDRDLDLAVLEVRDVRKYKIPVEHILPFDRVGKTQSLQAEAKVFAVGLPVELSNLPAQPDEFVKAVGVQLIFQSSTVKKGYSGGALFDGNWQLIAMIRADEPPFAQAVAIDQIIARLKDWGYPVALSVSSPVQR